MRGGVCTTPPEVTAGSGPLTVGVHWLRAVTKEPVREVVGRLAGVLGEDVEERAGGMHGYSDTFVLGKVKVWHNPMRPEMGACLEVTGEACEALGPTGLVGVWDAAEWRAARVDLAVDHCPFKPADLAAAWRAGQVDTRVKSLGLEGEVLAMEGRESWRRCEWSERPEGDLFGMGSRASGQYARAYNRRGFTRFELELKKATAHAAGPVVMKALREGASTFAPVVLSLVQRFVRFVDREGVSNVTRAPLLPFWAEFVGGVEKARLRVGEAIVRTVAEVKDWLERQVAPSLAVLRLALGYGEVEKLIDVGRKRFGRRQLETLRLAGVG